MNTVDHNPALNETVDLLPFVANPCTVDEWDAPGASPMMLSGMTPFARIARVLGVCDGDTLKIDITGWREAEFFRPKYARLFGLDAPELHDVRTEIREVAFSAREALRAACMDAGNRLVLRIRAEDKYGGRIVADFTGKDGVDIGRQMREAGLVRPYTGVGSKPW